MGSKGGKAFWFSGAATALAVLSCYGTTALIGLLSLLGVSLALDGGVWAGAISVFATLATVAIAASYRRHRVIGPTVAAVSGLALILWVMYGAYSRVIELLGFVLLITATLWDWRAGARRDASADGLSWVEASDLADRLKRDSGLIIVDVRNPDEFQGPLGHIAGAINLPLGQIETRLDELRRAGANETTVVCRTDKRSANAAAILRAAGFANVTVLRGGMESWNATIGQSLAARPAAADRPATELARP